MGVKSVMKKVVKILADKKTAKPVATKTEAKKEIKKVEEKLTDAKATPVKIDTKTDTKADTKAVTKKILEKPAKLEKPQGLPETGEIVSKVDDAETPVDSKADKNTEILTETKTKLSNNFDSERQRLQDIATQLDALRARLNKVDIKDREIRLNNLKKDNDQVDDENFNKVHSAMFKIMEKYEVAKQMLKAISMSEDVVNELLTKPDVQRPLNEKVNVKPVSTSQQTKKDKKIITTKQVDIEGAKKDTQTTNDAPVASAPSKKSDKVKAVIEKLENVIDDVEIVNSENTDSKTIKANTDKDNSFDDNKTDNKGPKKSTSTKAKAVEVVNDISATDSDVLKASDEPELLKDIKKDI